MNVSFISATDISVGVAALYALVGFVIVLLVLALLVGIFYLSGYLFRTELLSKEKLFERKKQSDGEGSNSQGQEEDIELETVAAITAAISATLEDDGVRPDFVIRRITRIK